MNTTEYFEEIEKQIKENYKVAELAREKGMDPVGKVEVPLAHNLAEKVVGLVSTIYPQVLNCGISERIGELEREYGLLDVAVCLKIAEEVSQERFCKFENKLQAIEAGIRVGFAYTTLGVVSSPIEGFTFLKLGKTAKGEDYFMPYFSGPIRSAGTTASCVGLFIIDYLREKFGYAKYDATENEIKRTRTELFDFHERITNLQYCPTEEEIEFIASNLPVQVAGEASEKLEVSNYKDLPRVDTNFLRSGFCLILGEGVAQKAPKALRILKGLREKGFKLSDWDWLEKYCELHEKQTLGKSKEAVATYMKDLVAGRPIFGHPSRSGGFRFRYGRSRVAGFSAVSIHPATMAISDSFIATGTQLKIEKPTKGCVTTVCDSVDGPIVKLRNGGVKKLQDFEEAKTLYKEVEEIIYFGDVLFPFGDLANRNADLIKPGYVEEWWNLELEKLGGKVEDCFNVDFEKAVEISEKYKVSLHPKYIYFWNQIGREEFLELLRWTSYGRINKKLILPYSPREKEKFAKGKRALELLGVEHEIGVENVIFSEVDSKSLFVNLGLDENLIERDDYFIEKELNEIAERVIEKKQDVLEIVDGLSRFVIRNKAGEFIGTRMGRPEKAKLRKLTGSPHVLFPIGEEGGRFRSVQEAVERGFVNAEFPIYFCEDCKNETIYRICEKCGKKTKKQFYSFSKQEIVNEEKSGESINRGFSRRKILIKDYFENARKILKMTNGEMPEMVKGVRGTSSKEHDFEHLSKGILRAKFNLNVNKDGTVRYDMTELPITHFKPFEIGISVEKLLELGYVEDIHGKELKSEGQILELKPHDIILPSNNEAGDEKADDVFFNLANFIDELLDKFYGLPRFYNLEKKEDLIGHLAVCMAPHNCAGVISRIIGFSKTQGIFASPFLHAAVRRDCDGDELASMLLLDVLINFSRKYLPSHRGGTQDAPLVLNGRIVAGEVDDQILDFELVDKYPLELYEKAEKMMHSSEVEIEMVKQRVNNNLDPFVNIGFTHDTEDFNSGVLCSSYKMLPTMQEKVASEMEFVKKMRCVDASDVARLIIERHFIRDIRGNLRKFSMQGFRCVKCNAKYRRPPLVGKCLKCNGKIIFTISEGGIVKYLEPALDLANNYDVPVYVKQNLELTKKYIESIFGREETRQSDLREWF